MQSYYSKLQTRKVVGEDLPSDYKPTFRSSVIFSIYFNPFLNFDVDIYEPTKNCLNLLFDRVVKGGLVLLDDYVSVFAGANKSVKELFVDKDIRVKRFPFSVTPCYFIK